MASPERVVVCTSMNMRAARKSGSASCCHFPMAPPGPACGLTRTLALFCLFALPYALLIRVSNQVERLASSLPETSTEKWAGRSLCPPTGSANVISRAESLRSAQRILRRGMERVGEVPVEEDMSAG